MAWKCNNCGNKYFGRKITKGFSEEYFDENGELEDNSITDIYYDDLECTKCSNEGNNIEDIAYWYPEKEMEE